jgi:TonB family protein
VSRQRRRHGWRKVVSCLVVAIAWSGPADAIATSADDGAGIPSLLQDWDRTQVELRESVWQTYAATAALGKDARGRTVAEDLDDWVMTKDVIAQLQKVRADAERQYRTGDERGARATLESGRAVAQEQRRRLSLINYYWQQTIPLDRQRDLWLLWLQQSPSPAATQSRERMHMLESALAQEISPSLAQETLAAQVESLKRAYNEERGKLAGLVSDQRIAAGGVIAVRERSTPCSATPGDEEQRRRASANGTGNRPVGILTNPSPDLFYPEDARKNEISGKVTLLLTIAANGCMERAEVVRSSGATELDEAAMDLSEDTIYLPAERGGRPVESTSSRVIGFQFSDSTRVEAAPAGTPTTADGYSKRAHTWIDRRDYERAIADFDMAIEMDPTAAAVLADRGTTYILMHNYDLARKDFDAAFAIDPRNATMLRGLGALAMEARNFADAIAAFTTSLEVEPNNIYALLNRANAYLRTNELDKALADDEKVVQLRPDSASSFIARGNTLLDRNDFDRAIADFDKALEIDPRAAMAFADRGMSYVGKYKYDLARKDFDAAYAIDPRNVVVLRGRGTLALRSDNGVEAISAFTASLQLQPNSAFALHGRAQAYLRNGNYEKALANIDEAIAVQPSAFDLYSFRALIFREQGKMDQSAGEAKALIAANPSTASAFMAAGRIYASSGLDVEAMHAFDRAVELTPNEVAYLTRARFRSRTDLAAKRADIGAALKVNSSSANALNMLAEMQSDAGDVSNAVAMLSAALANKSDNYELLTRRGIIYAKSNQQALAEADFAAARAKATNAQALNTICWEIATADVALATALGACDAAVAETPDYPNAIDSRGLVLLRLGRYADAITCYDAELKIRALSAASLYGRGLAKQHQGRAAEGGADIRAALTVDATIAEIFADYGLQPQAP